MRIANAQCMQCSTYVCTSYCVMAHVVSSPRRSLRIRLLREMLSSSSTETPQVRRSPRGLSRRLIREAKTEAHGSGSVLGKRARPRDYATDSTPSKRSKDCFNIETTTESAIEMYQETLNFTCYSDELNVARPANADWRLPWRMAMALCNVYIPV